jgi:hypothetical protein
MTAFTDSRSRAREPGQASRRHTSWQSVRPAALCGPARARWLEEQLEVVEEASRRMFPSEQGFRWTTEERTEGWLGSRRLVIRRRDFFACITTQWFQCGSSYRASPDSAGLRLRTTAVYCANPVVRRRFRPDPHGTFRFAALGIALPTLLAALRGASLIVAHPSRCFVVDGAGWLLAIVAAIAAAIVLGWSLHGLIDRLRRDTVLITPTRELDRFETLLRHLREPGHSSDCST